VKRLFEKLGLSNSKEKEKEKEAGKVIKAYTKETKDVYVTGKLNGIAFESMAKDDTLKGCFFSKKE
jgi:hypothetical protein